MNINTNQKGFTIVELLIVIVVIAILAAISIVAYTGIQNRARNSAAVSTANQVAGKVRAYHALTGNYPTGISGNAFTPTVANTEEASLAGVNVSTAAVPTGTLTGAYGDGTLVHITFGTASTPPTIHYRNSGTTSATMTP